MTRRHNQKKQQFLSSIPTASIESENDLLATKCKFNFAYFDKQPAGQSFGDWTAKQRLELLEKLTAYSKESLEFWKNMPIGKGSGTVLSIYKKFPAGSAFSHPKHVPHEAEWGRFRLDCSGRLVGFILPKVFDCREHSKSKAKFDCNTFYIVFLDEKHHFYPSNEPK